MKTKIFAFTLFVVGSISLSVAQDATFRVMMNKGNNEVKAGTTWEILKVGTSLKKTDEIRLGQNSYLGLIHSTGKPLELKNAGNYKIADLAEQVGKGASILNKYTDFILSTNTQRKGNLTATGAVHRGTNNIRMYLPPSENAFVYGDSITIQWSKQSPAPYEIVITDIFATELLKQDVKENSFTINMNNPVFNNENDLQVKVTSKTDRKVSDEYVIRKLSKANKEKLKASYAEMISQTKENTALNKFIQAGFFEQNKLLIEAATAYQKAVKLEPGYQEFYNDFLIRNGMKDPKEK
jgi:hypothetical protein